MKTLELKHIAPYLPYNVMVQEIRLDQFTKDVSEKIYILHPDDVTLLRLSFDHIKSKKLVLRPPSDLTKEIEVNGEKFVPAEKLKEINSGIDVFLTRDFQTDDLMICTNPSDVDLDIMWYHLIISKLLEWHFDIFNLIPVGLAIDFNALNQTK